MNLSEHKTTTPYHLPDGYFDALRQSVDAKLKNIPAGHEAIQINFIASDTPQSVPQNYFGQMQDALIAKLDQTTSSQESTDLISQESYQTPSRYFEEPPAVPKPKKPIPLYSNSSIFSNIAATFLILITIGALYIKPTTNTQSPSFSMEDIQDSEWEHYLATEGDLHPSRGNDPVVNLDYISQQEVKQFLKEEEEYLNVF